MQEAQAPIISNSVLKHSAKNAIPIQAAEAGWPGRVMAQPRIGDHVICDNCEAAIQH